jgi:hypothetical protein
MPQCGRRAPELDRKPSRRAGRSARALSNKYHRIGLGTSPFSLATEISSRHSTLFAPRGSNRRSTLTRRTRRSPRSVAPRSKPAPQDLTSTQGRARATSAATWLQAAGELQPPGQPAAAAEDAGSARRTNPRASRGRLRSDLRAICLLAPRRRHAEAASPHLTTGKWTAFELISTRNRLPRQSVETTYSNRYAASVTCFTAREKEWLSLSSPNAATGPVNSGKRNVRMVVIRTPDRRQSHKLPTYFLVEVQTRCRGHRSKWSTRCSTNRSMIASTAQTRSAPSPDGVSLYSPRSFC